MKTFNTILNEVKEVLIPEKEFWAKAKKLDKEFLKYDSKKIKKIIKSNKPDCEIYNNFEDIAYYAMENAMPGKNVFTQSSLDLYANSLEGIISDTNC